MKKQILILIYIAIYSIGFAQVAALDDIDTTQLNDYKYLLSIPDNPAFKAINFDASNAIKPSEVKAFSLSFDPFSFSGGDTKIPLNIGIEIAPYRYLNDFKFSKYNANIANKIMYHSALSFATGSQGNGTDVSFGYRMSLPLGSDPLSDKSFHNNLANYTLVKHNFNVFLTQDYFWQFNPAITPLHPNYTALSTSFAANHIDDPEAWNAFIKQEDVDPELKQDYFTTAQPMVAKYLEDNWNRPMMDVAVSWVGNSGDSTINDLNIDSWNVWASYSGRISNNKKSWMSKYSLLLVGFKYQWRPAYFNTLKDNDFAFYGRMYMGKNKAKFYAEYEFLNRQFVSIANNQKDNSLSTKTSSLSLGGEFYMGKNIWIDFTTGVQDFTAKNEAREFVTAINLKYGIQSIAKSKN